jgi:hypothetical protein
MTKVWTCSRLAWEVVVANWGPAACLRDGSAPSLVKYTLFVPPSDSGITCPSTDVCVTFYLQESGDANFPFNPADSAAQCPPTAAQVKAGLTNCALAVFATTDASTSTDVPQGRAKRVVDDSKRRSCPWQRDRLTSHDRPRAGLLSRLRRLLTISIICRRKFPVGIGARRALLGPRRAAHATSRHAHRENLRAMR